MKASINQPTQGPYFSMEVIVDSKPLTEYQYLGQTIIESAMEQAYQIRVRNYTGRNCEVVISVDGLSIMNGEKASINDSGYLIQPSRKMDIPGWYRDGEKAAEFFFSKASEGYAHQMGKGENTGVISAAFFYEQHRRPITRGSSLSFGGAMAKGGGLESSSGSATGYGREVAHNTTKVQFTRDPEMAAQLTLRYDNRAGLERRGIYILDNDSVLAANPFPADIAAVGTQAPPGWDSQAQG